MMLRNRIRRVRKSKGLTLEALAELAQVGRSTISGIERNEHIPGIDVALKIAQALNTKVDRLFWLDKIK